MHICYLEVEVEVEAEVSEEFKEIVMAEAQLRDQHGNPIPLTDQHGNPVILTDEHGNPVHVTGIATIPPSAATAASGFRTYSGAGSTTVTTTVADLIAAQPRDTRDLHRSSSSSSSSSSVIVFISSLLSLIVL